MSRTVFVNGSYLPEEDAKVSIFDRGFLFADGVYEVSSVVRGRLIDNRAHLERLHRSLEAIEIEAPLSDSEIAAIQQELIARNSVDEGVVYLQVTRGAAERDFSYPKAAKPTLVMFTQAKRLIDNPLAQKGISVVTTPDIRWARRDIKTVGLLASSMAKMVAVRAGADDAWMVENGYVTEGSSNNAYIVTGNNTIVTRHLSREILSGITRQAVLKLAAEAHLSIEERPFTPAEAHVAHEAFITSASTFVMPVVKIDDTLLGDGKPGALSLRLREIYIAAALAEIGK